VERVLPSFRLGDRLVSAAPSRAVRATAVAAGAERRTHLVFEVAGHPFALPVLAVERIVRLANLMPVPKAPAALRGAMLLEDDFVAVLDLTALFDRAPATPPAESCVLITGKDIGAGGLACGLLCDAGPRVEELAACEIAAPPRAGGLFAAQWIAGMLRTSGGFVPILDLANLLGSPGVSAAVTAAGTVLEEPRREPADGRRQGSKST
jgi:purine-binding chemotaxis protein CheW